MRLFSSSLFCFLSIEHAAFFRFPCSLLCTVFVFLPAAVVPCCRRAVEGTNERKAADLYELHSAMVHAVWVGNCSAVARLLSSGNSANKPIGRPGGTFPLIYVATQYGYREMVALLLDREARVNAAESRAGSTSLMLAAEGNRLSIVSLLLDKGASVNQACLDGDTALMTACENGNLSVAQLLVSSGAVVDQADNQGNTALSLVCMSGHVPVISFMLGSGADVRWQDVAGTSPLMYASANGHTEAVALLLRRGAVVDLLNKNGNTALHSACHFEHEGAVRLLLTAGASTTLQDNQSRCAMDWATAPRPAVVRQILAPRGLPLENEGAVRYGLCDMDCATAPRNAAVRHILQQHMHAEEQ